MNMMNLSRIKYTEGGEEKIFSLRDKISTQWRDIGMLLGIPVQVLDDMGRGRGQPSSIKSLQNIMMLWVDGQGARNYPVTWDGLYDVLKDVGLAQLVHELKAAIDSFRKCIMIITYYTRNLWKLNPQPDDS